MQSKSYTETHFPLAAALAKITKHGFAYYLHHVGNCIYCHNDDGSYLVLYVGDTNGVPLEDHTKPDGSWNYPFGQLYVIAHEYLPEYINLKE